ncbi:glycosyltransferase family 39 protein [Arsenicitalea aurantiaca]|uniref:Glycosyltransferase family 39 protein n=1 Tax=Arsenicitalea aurantiaca TaxID=1783274 RepID=A0A433X281_9HYPH|nr:glycosyltransferase family 39 protein [Arsenicitalea aurantiaca]RUT28214.1 glycosyltransferase family 39 protein [Arsenicitalea aurantiaca]
MSKPLPHWSDPRFVALFVLVLTAIRLVVAGTTGLVHDENYYALWSTALSPGYLDHAPGVAWFVAAGTATAGESALGVRLFAVLSMLGVSAALWRIGMLLFDRRVAALGVIWYNLTLAGTLGFLITPDTPSLLFWVLAVWALAEFMAGRNANWWLAVGLFAGLGLLGKYTNAFLGLGILLLIASGRTRWAWLRLWQVWAGGAIAILVFSPVLFWNAANGWASFVFQGRRTVGGDGSSGNLGEMLLGQALFNGPTLFILAILAGVWFARRRADEAREGLALVLLTALPMLAYFLWHALHGRVEANWLVPAWPGLSLAAAWAALALRPRGWRAGLRKAGLWLQPLLGIAFAMLFYVQAIWTPFAIGSGDRTAEMRDWDLLEAGVQHILAQTDADWVATSRDYPLTGALVTAARFAGRSLDVHQIDERARYGFQGPLAPEALSWPALYVVALGREGEDRAPLDRFGSVTPLGTITRMPGEPRPRAYGVYRVADPLPAFFEAWTDAP